MEADYDALRSKLVNTDELSQEIASIRALYKEVSRLIRNYYAMVSTGRGK